MLNKSVVRHAMATNVNCVVWPARLRSYFKSEAANFGGRFCVLCVLTAELISDGDVRCVYDFFHANQSSAFGLVVPFRFKLAFAEHINFESNARFLRNSLSNLISIFSRTNFHMLLQISVD